MTLSKKRYAAVQAALAAERGALGLSEEQVGAVLAVVCRTLGFDPSQTSYTPRAAASNRAWRARQAEEARRLGVAPNALITGRVRRMPSPG